MRYLLDTNILLWWLEDDKRLKNPIRQIIGNEANQIQISIVSGLEISIKNKLGRLPLKTKVKDIFKISGFLILDINLNHVTELDKLPLHKNHKDPFDRILISQANAENLTLITSDQKIWKYKVSLIKA